MWLQKWLEATGAALESLSIEPEKEASKRAAVQVSGTQWAESDIRLEDPARRIE